MYKLNKSVIIFTLLFVTTQVFALEIMYEPRTPYIQEENNTIIGLVASPLIKSLNKANTN